jgi:hypothetical protein
LSESPCSGRVQDRRWVNHFSAEAQARPPCRIRPWDTIPMVSNSRDTRGMVSHSRRSRRLADRLRVASSILFSCQFVAIELLDDHPGNRSAHGAEQDRHKRSIDRPKDHSAECSQDRAQDRLAHVCEAEAVDLRTSRFSMNECPTHGGLPCDWVKTSQGDNRDGDDFITGTWSWRRLLRSPRRQRHDEVQRF